MLTLLSHIRSLFHMQEMQHYYTSLAVAAFLAFGIDRLVHRIWNIKIWERWYHKKLFSAPGTTGISAELKVRSVFLFGIAHSFAISAQVYLCLCFAQIIMDFFPSLRHFSPTNDSTSLSEAAPHIAFTLWSGLVMATIKRVALLRSVSGKRLGRMALLDYLLDFVIFMLTLLNILDQLKVDMSVGIQSILSAGGIGALVFSLASKDLAEQMVGGFSLSAWEAFDVGDKVRLGDGTDGYILEIGLVETLIKGFDNIITRIPNSQLTSARIQNLSRVKQSRLKHTVRFRYDDIEKLPDVLKDIKEEIRLSCPKLATKRPFHAVLISYEADHINCMVLAHFDIQPSTGAFINNRHDFLLAIARAMRKHNISFALPAMIYHGPLPPTTQGVPVSTVNGFPPTTIPNPEIAD